MKFCGQCGARLEQPGKFCSECGAVLVDVLPDAPRAAPAPVAAPVPATPLAQAAPPPPPPPPPPVEVEDEGEVRRRDPVAIAAIVVGILVLLGLFAVMVPKLMDIEDGAALAEASSVPSATSAPAPVETTSLGPPIVEPANLVTMDGMMGIFAGTSWEEAAARFKPEGSYGGEAEGCDIYTSRNGRISAMVEGGVITSISTEDTAFRTETGVGIGSTVSDLRSAYGSRLKAEENPYSGRDYFVENGNGNGIKFHTENGRVSTITSGGSSIRYVEGCL